MLTDYVIYENKKFLIDNKYPDTDLLPGFYLKQEDMT